MSARGRLGGPAATAVAHPNIALVKYWGKRDERLNLPFQSSLSVTLAPLAITTTVAFTGRPGRDAVRINERDARGRERERVSELLALVRAEASRVQRRELGAARVSSRGDFPASAGLASSAAAFAALAVAARTAAGLERAPATESELARRGSGSACRSIHGGFVRWARGRRRDGRDSVASPLFPPGHWPELRLVVGLVSRDEKAVTSRDGMRLTVETSPYYRAWTADAEAEVARASRAIAQRDLEALGELAERNAWRMHATALAADPPLCYLLPKTLEIIQAAAAERRRGVGVYFTLDAGPNPVLLTSAADEPRVVRLLRALGALEVVRCVPGGGVRVELANARGDAREG